MTTQSLSTSGLLDRIPTLAEQFSSRARETEQLGQLPTELVAEAKAAGLFMMALPKVLGGLEVDPATFVEVVEEISRADASAGWCTVIGNSTLFFAWLDPAVAAELLAGAGGISAAGSFSPIGRLTPVGPGGYRMAGHWKFMSGCRYADWTFLGGHVMAGDAPRMVDGEPDWRLAVLNRDQVEVVDNWDVFGLCGTGSHDLAVRAATIPEEHTMVPFFQPPPHDGPLWRLPFFTLINVLLAGHPLGVGRRALDEFTTLARTRTRATASTTIAAEDDAQVALTAAEGDLQSARSLLFDAIGDLWDTACRGDVPDADQRARLLLGGLQAMRAARTAVDTAYTFAGASAVYAGHPLQRCFRDLHVAAQHVGFSPAAIKRYARTRLGIDQPAVLF
ncbi:MAG TPA: acyl-CoA dehydrogenase family protein [Actinophytocola sp.]|uniref:acyl-CoA dehydrogenase family protein n=1 Tax=Actinophytocola sp. TaxID=1872138 RepID=UPI002DB62D4B|nr:acyl-CoA dehydrogenase family protein [Actinophytocola sp.]HEU5472566.1 acyl-CoA dehydrogenase family protein [Actinophytocola sp.]